MVVYQLSTAARQEARQWSAEVNVVFSAQHMKAVQTKKKGSALVCTGRYAKKCQGVQDIFQTSMESGLQVGQTEGRELRLPRMPSMGVG